MTHVPCSVVVPTFGRPGALARCLAALGELDHDAGRLEVIVVDDGGGTSLDAVLAPVRERLPVRLLAQANGGPAAARNLGAAHAEGELLLFTDDDCAPQQGWLRALVATCAADPGAGAGGRTLAAIPGDRAAATAQRIIDAGYAHLNTPEAARFLTSNNLALPVTGFREVGGFDERLRTSEDRDLCDRWVQAGLRLRPSPTAVVEHRHTGGIREFWRQHVAYARGARRFHVLHAARAGHRPRLEPRFYLDLLRDPCGYAPRGQSSKRNMAGDVAFSALTPSVASPSVARARALVTLWLAATAVGYAREAVTGRAWLAEPAGGVAAPARTAENVPVSRA